MLLGVPLESRGACRAFLAAGHGAIGRRRAVNEKGASSRKLAEACAIDDLVFRGF